MANIKIDVPHTITDGSEVSFTAPCDCTAVTGLKVYHPGGSKVFTFKDAHGNDLTGIGNLFESGAIVKALLDTTNGHAYLQNADTNAYLETALSGKANASHNHSASNITSGTLATDRLPTVPITKGGTNATTAPNARKNLGLTAFSTYQQTGVNDLQAGINNIWGSVGNGESFVVSVKTSSAYSYTAFGIKVDTNNGYVFAIGQGNLTRLYSKSSGTWTIYTISKSAGA